MEATELEQPGIPQVLSPDEWMAWLEVKMDQVKDDYAAWDLMEFYHGVLASWVAGGRQPQDRDMQAALDALEEQFGAQARADLLEPAVFAGLSSTVEGTLPAQDEGVETAQPEEPIEDTPSVETTDTAPEVQLPAAVQPVGAEQLAAQIEETAPEETLDTAPEAEMAAAEPVEAAQPVEDLPGFVPSAIAEQPGEVDLDEEESEPSHPGVELAQVGELVVEQTTPLELSTPAVVDLPAPAQVSNFDEDDYRYYLRMANRATTEEALRRCRENILTSGMDENHPKVAELLEDIDSRLAELQQPAETPVDQAPAGAPAVQEDLSDPVLAPVFDDDENIEEPGIGIPAEHEALRKAREQKSLAEQKKIDDLLAEIKLKMEQARSASELNDLRNLVYASGVDTSHTDIYEQLRNIEARIKNFEISDLKRRLQDEQDIGALEKLLQQARNAIFEMRQQSGVVDSSLEQLLENAQSQFNAKREAMGQRTTRDALKDLDNINIVLQELEAALKRGERTFYDQRNNTIRQINQLSPELLKLREELALEASDRNRSRAMLDMPADDVRHPGTALEKLKQAFVEGLSEAARADMEALQANWSEQKARYDQAEAIVQQPTPEQDGVNRLRNARRAQKIYRYHPDVYSLDTYILDANRVLANRIKKALEKGAEDLAGEAKEAERQRKSGKARDELPAVLKDVLLPLNAIEKELEELNLGDLTEAEYSPELQQQIEGIKTFRAQVRQRLERRKDIRLICDQIIRLVKDRSVEQAKTLYKEQPDDFRGDPELKSVHKEHLEPLYEVGDLYNLAVDQYNNRLWSDCKDTCDRIQEKRGNRAEQFDQKVIDLRKRTVLQLVCQDIDETWQGEYYNQCQRKIDEFYRLSREYTPAQGFESLVDDLAAVSKIDEKQEEFAQRQKADKSHNMANRLREFSTQMRSIINQCDALERDRKSAAYSIVKTLAVKITDLSEKIEPAAKLASNYVGELRDLRETLAGRLHQVVLPVLVSLHASEAQSGKPLTDYELAYTLVDSLHRCEQVQVEDAELRRWAVMGYYQQQAAENRQRAHSMGNERPLEANINNWRNARQRFHSPRIETEAEYACIEYLIFRVDRLLKNRSLQQAQELLSGSKTAPVLEGFDLENAPDRSELDLRRQVIRNLGTVEAMFQREDYDTIPDLLKSLAATLNGAAVSREALKENRRMLVEVVNNQRDEMVGKAVNNLIGKGDLVLSTDLAAAVGAYARALNLQPGHMTATARLKQINASATRQIIEDLKTAAAEIEQARPYSPGHVLNERLNRLTLEESLVQLNQLSINLKHIQLAADYLGLSERDKTELGQKQAGVDDYKAGLTACCNRVQSLRVGQPEWKTVQRTRKWGTANTVLNKLDEMGITDEQPDYQELKRRVSVHSRVSDKLQDLKTKLEGYFQDDDFENALAQYDKVASSVVYAQLENLKEEAQAARAETDAAQNLAVEFRREVDQAKSQASAAANEVWIARLEEEAAQKEAAAGQKKEALAGIEAALSAEPPFPPEDPYRLVTRDYDIFDIFLRKPVRFYGRRINQEYSAETPAEDLPVRPLLQQRQDNLQLWQALETDYHRMAQLAVRNPDTREEMRPRLNGLDPETKRLLLAIQKYLAYAEDMERLGERFSRMPAPTSQSADEVKAKCQNWQAEIQRQLHLANEDEKQLKELELDMQGRIDQALEDFQNANFERAFTAVEQAMVYYGNSDDPNEAFLTHLQSLISRELSPE